VIVEPGAVIGGKYKLEQKLAAGGMGSVWLARHLQLQTDVAVKLLDVGPAASADAHARFEREAKALSKLRHPNIVQVHDFGLDDDMPYLVMELLRGESVDARLKRDGRMPIRTVGAMLGQVAKGLRRAHEAGFVHRDLKPGNLFIVKGDDEETFVILDFGIAKQTGVVIDNSTKTGEFMGSPHYMSPEQIRDSKDIDARSDLWSLAVILFRALTGVLPFPGTTLGAVLADVVSAPIPKILEAAPDLPPELDPFFDKAFSRDRTKRFASAREMAEAFDAVLRAKEPPAPAAQRPRAASPGSAAAAPGPPRPAAGSPGPPRPTTPSNSTNFGSNSDVAPGAAASPAAQAGAAASPAAAAHGAPASRPMPPKATAGPKGTALYSREALKLPAAPGPPDDPPPAPPPPPAAAWEDRSQRGQAAQAAPPAAAWDDPSKRGQAPAQAPAAPAWDDPSKRAQAPAPSGAGWDDRSQRGEAPQAAPPAAAWDDRSQRGQAATPAPPAAAWKDASVRGYPAPPAPTWDDPSQRAQAPAPSGAAWDDRSQRSYAAGAPGSAAGWEDPSKRGPAPAPAPSGAAWDDRSQRGYPPSASPQPAQHAGAPAPPGMAPPSNPGHGAAPSRPGSWEDVSHRSFPGYPPPASQTPGPPRSNALTDATLSSAQGTAAAGPTATPIPEPRPSTRGFDPSRGPVASTPVLGSTLTVSPSARDSSAERPPSTGGNKPTVPFAAKVGAAAAGALLTVIILVFALRSSPPSGAEGSPGTSLTAATAASIALAPPPPPTQAAVAAPVEGVLDIPEGEAVAEAIAAEPELLEQMDGGPGPSGPKIPPIPFGKSRLIVVSKSGPCKVTVNGVSQGVTPVHIFVNPGKTKVYCRLTTGSTRSRELDVPRMRTTFVIFENPAADAPKPK
jgi:serine/threonine-protein kinase